MCLTGVDDLLPVVYRPVDLLVGENIDNQFVPLSVGNHGVIESLAAPKRYAYRKLLARDIGHPVTDLEYRIIEQIIFPFFLQHPEFPDVPHG